MNNYKNLTLSQKKTILYKLSEIFSNDDTMLDFIDGLEGDNINFVFDFALAKSEQERNNIYNKHIEELGKMVCEMELQLNNINKLSINLKELVDKSKEKGEIDNLESLFGN